MSKRCKLLSFLALTAAFTASAQEYNFSFYGIGANIPDQNPFGVTDVRIINVGSGLTITDVDVSLTILGTGGGGFNGDLYATLRHESGFSVLLNRPGARPGTPSGYSDNGLNITFNDGVPQDIHSYRLVLTGDENVGISDVLTGTWAPDGRNVDPDLVSPSSPRDSMLSSFNALPLDGTWSLFVSDLSAGGTHRIDGWSMRVQAVPEPGPVALTVLFLLAAWFRRRCAKS